MCSSLLIVPLILNLYTTSVPPRETLVKDTVSIVDNINTHTKGNVRMSIHKPF